MSRWLRDQPAAETGLAIAGRCLSGRGRAANRRTDVAYRHLGTTFGFSTTGRKEPRRLTSDAALRARLFVVGRRPDARSPATRAHGGAARILCGEGLAEKSCTMFE